MSNQNENFGNDSKKISWVSILNAIVQAIIAALTALGVSSCANNIAFKIPLYMIFRITPSLFPKRAPPLSPSPSPLRVEGM